jgi:rhodanese-related sulfurtransferase
MKRRGFITLLGVAAVLKDMGYERVYNLGGFKDWAESGGAVEK